MRLGSSSQANNRGPRNSGARSPEPLSAGGSTGQVKDQIRNLWDAKITSYLPSSLGRHQEKCHSSQDFPRVWEFPLLHTSCMHTGREADDQLCHQHHAASQALPGGWAGSTQDLATARPPSPPPLHCHVFPTAKGPRVKKGAHVPLTKPRPADLKNQFAVLWHVESQISQTAPLLVSGRRMAGEEKEDQPMLKPPSIA